MRQAERDQRGYPEFVPHTLIEQGIERLLAELQQGQSEHLEQYLAFIARFHRYSVHNQMLIYMQCPHATYVAGYCTWQEMGYQVAKGQKGIRILAPRPYKRLNQETAEEEPTMSFVAVSVFDASQLTDLDQKPLPTFFTPLGNDQPALYQRLVDVVKEDGVVIDERNTGRAEGYSVGGRIVISENKDSRNKVLILIHEYAHELLHWKKEEPPPSRQVEECHAEAISYVVAHHFGIHNPFSADYLHYWGTTPKELLAELETVRRTAAYIIGRAENTTTSPNSVYCTPKTGHPGN